MEARPFPRSATVCGLPAGLSAMLRVPFFVPAAPGLKVTAMVQSAPALTVLPQVLVWEKSPLAVMPEIVRGVSLVLVSVTVWVLLLVPTTWAENISDEEDILSRGAAEVNVGPGGELPGWDEGRCGRPGATVLPGAGLAGGKVGTGGWGPTVKTRPAPLSATVWGLPAALSVMMTAPVLVPGPRGLKVTAIVQLTPAPKVAPQVLVWEKSPVVIMP